MKITSFKNVNIIFKDKIKKGSLSVNGDEIASFRYRKNAISLPETLYLAPGFIDEHIHGANGSDTMDGTIDALENIATSLVQEGVTSFLPTTMTMPEEDINRALDNIKNYMKEKRSGARVIGCHLEGPFISPLHPGAQDPKAILKPDEKKFASFYERSGKAIKEVTIAYEEGGEGILSFCNAHHITASLGHSDCKAKIVKEAISKGLHSITHLFNAQRGLNHREPGIVGEALLTNGLKTEVICDLIHSSEDALKLVFKNKLKEDIVLITDSTEGKYLKPGYYELGGQKVKILDGVARLMNDTIAGSILRLDTALKNISPIANNYSFNELINLASLNAAKNLGVDDKYGQIALGHKADFVIIDRDFNVYATIVGGEVSFLKEGFHLN